MVPSRRNVSKGGTVDKYTMNSGRGLLNGVQLTSNQNRLLDVAV